MQADWLHQAKRSRQSYRKRGIVIAVLQVIFFFSFDFNVVSCYGAVQRRRRINQQERRKKKKHDKFRQSCIYITRKSALLFDRL